MSFRTPLVYYLIITLTLLISFLSVISSDFSDFYGLVLSGIFIGLIGIPHGATDHLIFNSLCKKNLSLNAQVYFYILYIFATIFFLLFWYLSPAFALNIFIAISAYHLGQSNLYYLHLPKNQIIKALIYSCWGLFIISALIISNSEEVNNISRYLLCNIWLINMKNKAYFLEAIIILNFLILSILFSFNFIQKKDFFRECLNLLVLSILFYTTSLMISFGVYFGLWHSLSSTFDQIQFLKQRNFKFNLMDFSFDSILFSIIPLIIFIIFALNSEKFSTQNFSLKTADFFIFIATITLPHTIVRDKLYKKPL